MSLSLIKKIQSKISKYLVKIKLILNPSNTKIIGNCEQCGECCRNLVLKFGNKIIATEKAFNRVKLLFPEYRIFSIKSQHPDYIIFECTKISNENLCTIYDTRPNICKEYPNGSINLDDYPPNEYCGYEIVPMIKFKEMLNNEKIK